MKKLLELSLILYLVISPYFYLPHLLTGSGHVWGFTTSGELQAAAVIRDVGLLGIASLYILVIAIRDKSIRIPSILFLLYAIVVSIRIFLHGFSGTFLKYVITDSGYILSVFVILVFFFIDWDTKKLNLVKRYLKLAAIPLLVFLIWEILNPDMALWLRADRYRSTLLTPTVLGQFSGFIFVVALFDLIKSDRQKLFNMIISLLSICLVFYSGSRTTFLVIIITTIILFMVNKMKVTERILSIAIISSIMVTIFMVFFFVNFDISSSRTFAINISGDGRLPRLIYEWQIMNVQTFFFGSIPESEAPLDISWFVFIKRLGIFGFISFLMLNVSVILKLLKKIRSFNISSYDKNILLNYHFLFILLFMSFCYLFTTNLMNAFPLNLFYWFSLGIGMKYIKI